MVSDFFGEKYPRLALILLGFLGILIVGCTQDNAVVVPTSTFAGELTPYLTVTKNQPPMMGSLSTTSTPVPTVYSTPTSTPLVHEVVEGDTLTGIASKHSVPLEELIAANPGIDPNFLTLGLTLTIPIEGVVSAALPMPTPVSMIIQPPVCYPQMDGSLHCISVIENNQIYSVENVEVLISLQTPVKNDAVSQIAIMPLNIIQAGQKAGVAASFPPPIPLDKVAQARLVSAIPISADDTRYLNTELDIQEIMISPDGEQASISGTVEILFEQSDAEEPVAREVWISAFAYDRQNNIVGIRKWVAENETISDNNVNFTINVYSLGPAIDRVDIITEAHP